MHLLDLARDLARIVTPGVVERGFPVPHDTGQQLADQVARWVRGGRQGVPQEGGTWLCGCPDDDGKPMNICLAALALCDLCGWSRPGGLERGHGQP